MKYLLSICIATCIQLGTAHASCISGNCSSGQGTYISYEGNKYVGQWHRGQRHGEGRLYYKSGDYYVGQFRAGTFEGRGKLEYATGEVYRGEWLAGLWHGQGEYDFVNGDRYIGTFIDGAISGKGALHYRDGARYEGAWAANQRHGHGTLYLSDGSSQSGQWSRGQLTTSHAVDILSTETTRDCTSGLCASGKGRYDYADGSQYVGQFRGGAPEGTGVCYYANGDIYRGGWSDHSPHGRGVMAFAESGKTLGAIWEYGSMQEQVYDDYSDLYELDPRLTKKQDAGAVTIYAVIVGVASYNHLPSLRYTDDDAYHLYAFLRSPEGGALGDDHIQLLIDDAASHQAIIQAVNTVTTQADENDVVLFYMSGHGFEGYFAPHDFDGYNNGLAYADLLQAFDKGRAHQKLFIADACHSGSMSAVRGNVSSSLSDYYSRITDTKESSAILMSSKSDEVSLEYSGMRQGVFSHFLIKGLKGLADADSDKIVSIGELYTYVDREVRTYTDHAQHPSMIGDYDRNMPVAMIR